LLLVSCQSDVQILAHELSHRLLSLCLAQDLDAERCQVCGQFRIQLGIVADVTVDIYRQLWCHTVRWLLTSSTLGRYGAEFDAHPMSRLIVMLQCMTITADASELLSPAVGQTTSQAQPEIRS